MAKARSAKESEGAVLSILKAEFVTEAELPTISVTVKRRAEPVVSTDGTDQLKGEEFVVVKFVEKFVPSAA